jgi:hypothetical protein
MNDTNITDNDIFMAIIEAQRHDTEIDPETFTRAEYQKKRGCGQERALNDIKAAIAAGNVKPEQIRRRNMFGISTMVWGYRWIG